MFDDETKYTIEEVVEFCKTAPIVIVKRDKTEAFIHKIECYDLDLLLSEIRNLRLEHSCAKPEQDYDIKRKGYVYQFKKLFFEKYWCYIKLKIKISTKESKVVIVISLHEEDINYEKN